MKDNLTIEDRMFGRYGTLTPSEDNDIKVFLSYTPYALIHYQFLTISDQAPTEQLATERKSMRGRDDYAL